ncbi:MAG: diol dehydratase small subunit [Romboutsia sp.]|uniref:diol dehydratase small subunit n=1 Tax=Romboutsia sp. TaxID=1965302 RepID=UPI003F36BEEA
MSQDLLIKQIVEEVLKNMQSTNINDIQNAVQSALCTDKVTSANYPLGEKIPDKIKSQSGMKLSDVTLDKVIKGEIQSDDIRISKETLEMQAQVAESVGRGAFAQNLRRAAELIAVPDDRILEIYDALRPYRATKKELYDIADELQNKYGCIINSNFVREAANVYEQRGRLKVED